MARAKPRKAAAMPARPLGLEQSGPVFDRAVRLAKALFGEVGASISLVGDGPAWRSHDPRGQIPTDAPATRLIVAEGKVQWIGDASQDPRFADRETVKGPLALRFLAGAPIRLEDGSIPGALVVAGKTPRPYDAELAERLQDLADFVADEWSRIRAGKLRDATAHERDAVQQVFTEVVENAPLPMVVTDAELNVISASHRWAQSLHLGDEQIVGRAMFEIGDGFFERWRNELENCLAGREIKAERVRAELANGDVRWFEVEILHWTQPTGELGGLIITAHDITDLVRAVERAERSQERLTLALQIADIHVWEMDYQRGELIKDGAEDTFFTEPKTYQDLVADIWGSIDPRDRPAAEALWEKHLSDGVDYHPEYRVMRSDGREVWAAGAVRMIADRNGEPRRLVGAMQNITQRKVQERALVQAKEEAEAANHAKSAFLATMSHEIRTPLNGVLGMAQAMALGELNDQQRGRLDVIRQSGESLLAILNDVLDLSKIEAGKLELEQAEFDLGELAKGAHATFAAIAEAKGVAFRLKVQPTARGTWLGDSVRIRQILYNLVSNALKFTHEGEVSVIVGREKGALKLSVRDTGIGVAPEKLGALFQKFEQADASMTRRYGGTGLGLAICRDLAQLMDGAIGAESRPGQGSTFWVTLKAPQLVAAAAASQPEARGVPSLPDRPLKVLAAEDNEMNQLVLKTLLAQVDIAPVMVRTGTAAVAAWAAEPWDLILMDVQMPEMDGATATGLIREAEAAQGRARTPIVALTANAMDHHVREYREAGMDAFVAKPIEARRLFEAIEDVLLRAPDVVPARVSRKRKAK